MKFITEDENQLMEKLSQKKVLDKLIKNNEDEAQGITPKTRHRQTIHFKKRRKKKTTCQHQILSGCAKKKICLVSWGCRIIDCFSVERQDPSTNKCPRYDTKQSDGEVPVMLQVWVMRSASSLPSLSGPLYPTVIAPDRVLSM